MGIHAYEVAADGSDWDEVAVNEITEQLGRINNTGLYPFNVTLQVPVDLSGAAAVVYLLHASRAMTLYKAIITYTEASSVDAGILLKIGKESDDDYYYTGTSEVSKAQWYERDTTLLQTDVTAGDTVYLTSAGGKVGTGEIIVTLEYGFTPT